MIPLAQAIYRSLNVPSHRNLALKVRQREFLAPDWLNRLQIDQECLRRQL